MKTLTTFILFLFIVTFCSGQKLTNLEVGNGISILNPNGGLSYNLIVESDLVETKFGKIRAEVSYLHGGSFFSSTYSDNSMMSNIITGPSKLRMFNLGANFRKNLVRFKNTDLYVSVGALGSVGFIKSSAIIHTEESVTIQIAGVETQQFEAISTNVIRVKKGVFSPVVPLKIGLVSEVGKLRLSYGLFNYFYINKYQNTGIHLSIGLR